MSAADDDLVDEFMAEAREGLDALDLDILLLEKNPDDREVINRIFRLAHTIKGGSGFLNLSEIGIAAHAAESLLSAYRDGVRKVTPEGVAEILAAFDKLRPLIGGQKRQISPEGGVLVAAMPAATSFVRVGAETLETLLENLGELILAKNRLLQQGAEDPVVAMGLQRLQQGISAMQDTVLRARMQPVRRAWEKLPRLVHDLSAELGKKVRLDMQGGDVQLDRQVLDMVRDPLTHMIRNAVDHGVETPAARRQSGKAEESVIHLSARHEGGYVVIRIADDGRGIDMQALRRRAAEMKFSQPLDDAGLLNLIFRPGFSTSGRVTEISGRGVGLDVVRDNMARLGGAVDVQSIQGKGSVFTLKLPLTLAIIPALLVEQDGDVYALPQLGIREVARLEKDAESVMGAPVIRRHGVMVPLASLARVFGAGDSRDGYAVIMESNGRLFGVIADRILGTEDIVVRALPEIFRDEKIYSGSAVLGSGRVAMILDTQGLATRVGTTVHENPALQPEKTADTTRLVLVRAGGLYAVPLQAVARLEKIDADIIERNADGCVMRYRGRLLPVLPLQDRVPERGHVVVLRVNEKMAALAVDDIVNVVEDVLDISIPSARAGSLGSAIVDGCVVDVVDAAHYAGHAAAAAAASEKTVLLVDDSDFFIKLLVPALSALGYQVVTAANAEAALKMCRDGGVFDIVISDIEMPGMSGFDFAQRLRAQGSRWRHVPLLALSAHATSSDKARGRAAGFDDYITKFDRDSLLGSIARAGGTA